MQKKRRGLEEKKREKQRAHLKNGRKAARKEVSRENKALYVYNEKNRHWRHMKNTKKEMKKGMERRERKK